MIATVQSYVQINLHPIHIDCFQKISIVAARDCLLSTSPLIAEMSKFVTIHLYK